jgi:hypothetical protein
MIDQNSITYKSLIGDKLKILIIVFIVGIICIDFDIDIMGDILSKSYYDYKIIFLTGSGAVLSIIICFIFFIKILFSLPRVTLTNDRVSVRGILLTNYADWTNLGPIEQVGIMAFAKLIGPDADSRTKKAKRMIIPITVKNISSEALVEDMIARHKLALQQTPE